MRNSLFIFKPPNQREDISINAVSVTKTETLLPPLFVTQKGCRSEFQDPPIKSFTSIIVLNS
jgi:hypothetical protein